MLSKDVNFLFIIRYSKFSPQMGVAEPNAALCYQSEKTIDE